MILRYRDEVAGHVREPCRRHVAVPLVKIPQAGFVGIELHEIGQHHEALGGGAQLDERMRELPDACLDVPECLRAK